MTLGALERGPLPGRERRRNGRRAVDRGRERRSRLPLDQRRGRAGPSRRRPRWRARSVAVLVELDDAVDRRLEDRAAGAPRNRGGSRSPRAPRSSAASVSRSAISLPAGPRVHRRRGPGARGSGSRGCARDRHSEQDEHACRLEAGDAARVVEDATSASAAHAVTAAALVRIGPGPAPRLHPHDVSGQVAGDRVAMSVARPVGRASAAGRPMGRCRRTCRASTAAPNTAVAIPSAAKSEELQRVHARRHPEGERRKIVSVRRSGAPRPRSTGS